MKRRTWLLVIGLALAALAIFVIDRLFVFQPGTHARIRHRTGDCRSR